MPAADFIDTNVLVYAYDPSDKRKQQIAQDLVRRGLAGSVITSTQVLAEFAATLLHKMSPPASPKDVQAVLDVLGAIPVVVPDAELVRRAVDAPASTACISTMA